MPVRKFLHLANNDIIIGVAVSLTADFTDFLQSIDNNKLCIRVLPHELFKLLIETVSYLFGIDGKVKIIRSFHAEHTEHTLLQTLVIIFKGKVQYRTLLYLVIPEHLSHTDVISELCHKK